MWGQRSGPKNRAAEINEQDLHNGDDDHDQQKCWVARDSRKERQSIGAGIEAVEDARKNKECKKGGQQINMIGCFPKMYGDGGELEEEQAKTDRETAQ